MKLTPLERKMLDALYATKLLLDKLNSVNVRNPDPEHPPFYKMVVSAIKAAEAKLQKADRK